MHVVEFTMTPFPHTALLTWQSEPHRTQPQPGGLRVPGRRAAGQLPVPAGEHAQTGVALAELAAAGLPPQPRQEVVQLLQRVARVAQLAQPGVHLVQRGDAGLEQLPDLLGDGDGGRRSHRAGTGGKRAAGQNNPPEA